MSQVSDVTNELKQTDNMVLQLKSDPLTEINNFIQQESLLMPYTETQDIYGTVDEYLEIVLLISFLMLFGMLFPLSYTLGFIWCSSEIQSDKFKIVTDLLLPIHHAAPLPQTTTSLPRLLTRPSALPQHVPKRACPRASPPPKKKLITRTPTLFSHNDHAGCPI